MTTKASRFRNLVDLLQSTACEDKPRVSYKFLSDSGAELSQITRGELDRQARVIGAQLQRYGVTREPILLLYPQGIGFIAALFGCLYAGAIAVPAYSPRGSRGRPRLISIIGDCRPRFGLTLFSTLPHLASWTARWPELGGICWIATDDPDSSSLAASDAWREPTIGSDALALLQYTSGSTASPKGVLVSHGNLLHNEALIQKAFRQTEESVVVGWLPLYHDMGLIGTVLQPLYSGGQAILMSPTSFLQRPVSWLEAISRYQADTSGGPDFAYDLCAHRVTEEMRENLDLSCWRVAFNGSEPVREATLKRFTAALEPCGFRREAFVPCYGLAEATLMVSARQGSAPAAIVAVDPEALQQNRVIMMRDEPGLTRSLVSSGRPEPDSVLIVHPESSSPCPPGEIGEIWICSPSVAQGYWERLDETESVFRARLASGEGPFLRTGDLGFLHNGGLFVTGRIKDLIIIRGRNHYPQDVELTAQSCHPSLRPGCGAAFSVEGDGEERIVLVQEVERGVRIDAEEVARVVRQAIAEEHELQLSEFVLIRPGALPKTTSGKIRRSTCRAMYLASELAILTRSALSHDGAGEAAAHLGLGSFSALTGPERSTALRSRLQDLATAALRTTSILEEKHPLTSYGLDSLAALALIHGIEETLGVELSVADLLAGASLVDLEREVLARLDTAMRREILPPPPIGPPLSAESPLSLGQRALWFLHRLSPESAAYNLASAMRLHTEVDVAALRRAFQALVDRHAALRTTFHLRDTEPVQHIHDTLDAWFEERDARTWDDPLLTRRLAEEAHRPFDLEDGPLLRAIIFRRSLNDPVLLVVAHHIVSDFWSLAILARELGALYTAAREGHCMPHLSPLAIDYRDFVEEENRSLAGSEGERLWAYWQRELAGELPVLDLPTDRARPAVQTDRGAARTGILCDRLASRLQSVASDHGVTLFTLLAAAFQALLHRHCDQDDLLIGSPTSGRVSRFSRVMGYFVHPVVLRADLSGNPTFVELLARTRRKVVGAIEHQAYPFPLLAERLQPERDPGRSPIFQVLLTFHGPLTGAPAELPAFALGLPGARLRLGELELESLVVETRSSQLDLEVAVAEIDGSLAATFRYNPDLFDASTIERLLGRFAALLEGVTKILEGRIADLPVLCASEREQLTREWNDTDTEMAPEACVHHLVAAQAQRTPAAVAVVCQGAVLTYGQLQVRSRELADLLRHLGVGPEHHVGIALEPSLDLPVCLLGVLEAGGAYVPLDPSYPAERLAFLLEDAGIRILLTQRRLLPLIPSPRSGQPQAICVDEPAQTVIREVSSDPAIAAAAGNLAYLLYTSGSTGEPKGVEVPHQALVNLLRSMARLTGLTERDAVLALTTLSFDIAALELFLPLIVGARVVLAGREAAVDGRRLAQTLADSRVTLAQATPATWKLLLQAGWEGDHNLTLLCGGEALSRDLADRLLERCAALWNLYGPTETTVYSTAGRVQRGQGAAPPIGRPIANLQAYVLDSNLRLVPLGAAGELLIGGAGVARGYLRRPGLTAERFVPDPFGRQPGGRLYRTGDRARLRPDGSIEYLGRLDQQIKIRGVRVEPGEIEGTLRRHPLVREAVVAAREDGGERRLVAYLVGNGPSAATDPVREWVRAHLPGALLPECFVWIEELPLTASGKVDRKRLPAPADGRPGGGLSSAPPRTPVEEIVATLWAELLGQERPGVFHNFFEAGGHSLKAAQLAARIREVLRVDLPLRSLFRAPTVAGIAREVEAVRRSGGVPDPPIGRAAHPGTPAVSFGQRSLWLIAQLRPGDCAYNMPGIFRFAGPLAIPVLALGLSEILRRHEALRTAFSSHAGRPVPTVAPADPLALPLVDLGELAADRREPEVSRLAAEEARRPFDLGRAPLLRTTLLRLSTTEHALLLTTHHIVADWSSLEIFCRELAALYSAFTAGKPSPLEDLPLQYADYAAWQTASTRRERLEASRAYWRDRLAGSERLALPTDRLRPAVPTARGSVEALELRRDLAADLDALCRRQGVTPLMVLLAAFQVLLSRSTGQEDIGVAVPFTQRDRVELESVIGFFVHLLIVRADLEEDATIEALLRRSRESLLEAYDHRHVPFEDVHEALGLGAAPLPQATLALQQNISEQDLGGARLRVHATRNGTAKHDLGLFADPSPDRWKISLEYSQDLFDGSTIRRMAGHLECLLEGLASSPGTLVSELPLLSQGERQQMLEAWNATAVPFPRDRGVHRLFEEQVAKTPLAVAVGWQGVELSYRELNRRANRLAHCLRSFGVGPETLVTVCLERSLDWVVSLLAVLKAGGAYVPLDPAQPPERLASLVEDAESPLVLTQRSLASFLPQGACLCVDGDWEGPWDECDPGGGAGPDNLAYMIYTSGSTGRPKGVLIEHAALANLIAWHQAEYEIGVGDRATHLAGLGFDASVWELWPYLTAGARVELAPPEIAASPAALLPWLAAHGTTHCFLPTPLAEAVLAEPLPTGLVLRTLLTGGDQLHAGPDTALPFRIVNHYGPTESTVVTTRAAVAAGVPTLPPIGRPIDNLRIYLLDRRLRPVPLGAAGELHVAGAGLARGYLGPAALTAERFIPDPFGGAGERLYRTGDLARYRPGGELEFLCRIDRQVKVRGVRIELGEVEASLLAHQGVREASVVPFESAVGELRLVAYVVPTDPALATAELRDDLRRKLPEPFVPSAFVVLPGLPRTSSGKLDRRALPPPGPERAAAAGRAPRGPVEEIVAAIWSDVLALEVVHTDDDFFELGGHSLLATQVVSRLRSALGVDLPLRSLFESRTVASLALLLENPCGADELRPEPPLERAAGTGHAPLSSAQRRLWFLDCLEPGSSAYHIAGAVHLEGELRVGALAAALSGVISRHEALRTAFLLADDGKVQAVATAREALLPLLDLTALPAGRRTGEVESLTAAEARRAFDLATGSPARTALLRLGAREHLLLIVLHHIAADGWSLGVLLRETAALYRAHLASVPAPLPELSIQYADYARWQLRDLEGERVRQQLAYWKSQLDGPLPVLELPADRPRPAVRSSRGARPVFPLSPGLREKLERLGRSHGVSLFMVLLAVFQGLLRRYTGQDDVLIGSPVANRDRIEIEELIGCFVNTLVLRIRVGGDLAFNELLGRVRSIALAAYDHRHVPFELLVEELRPGRNPAHTPLIQVMLVLQNAPRQRLELPGLVVREVDVDVGVTKLDLTLSVEDRDTGLAAVLEYATDLFDASTMARLAGHFANLLADAAARPERAFSELQMLSAAERHQLLRDWNDTHAELTPELLHRLFETQAERTPDAVALSFEGKLLSYAELDRRANQTARHLLACGGAPGSLVGLCAERSFELIVGLLGILKAGAAYVPLDSSHPRDRLAFLLEETRMRVVLTQERLQSQLSADSVRRICLDADWPQIELHPASPPAAAVDLDAPAYVIYTSGSTGRPKGVMNTHRAIANRLLWMQETYGLAPRDCVLHKTPVSFDVSVWEIFWPLMTGARLTLARPEGHKDPSYLAERIAAERVTVLHFVPSMLQVFLDQPDLAGCVPVRLVVASGEALPVSLERRFFERLGARLENLYGPTEAAVEVTFWSCHPERAERSIPIGRPIANVEIFLFDPDGGPAPLGVPGELAIGGVAPARGYLSRPDLTAERFIPHPLADTPGARLYRTGDLARYLPGGEIEFLGRLDHQVKIRGFRIELGEIEAALRERSDLTEAAVLAREEPGGDRRLVAYVVATEEPGPSSAELRSSLRQRLPEYMVPAELVFLPSLPRGPNGKLDRKALPAPGRVRQVHAFVPPRNAIEEQVALLWGEVLGIERVGLHDDFFELGGHSLLATQLLSRVRDTFHLTLPLRDVFAAPTVAGLAGLITQQIVQLAGADSIEQLLNEVEIS